METVAAEHMELFLGVIVEAVFPCSTMQYVITHDARLGSRSLTGK